MRNVPFFAAAGGGVAVVAAVGEEEATCSGIPSGETDSYGRSFQKRPISTTSGRRIGANRRNRIVSSVRFNPLMPALTASAGGLGRSRFNRPLRYATYVSSSFT